MYKYLWSLFLLLSLKTSAQVSMTVQLPPAGVMLKSQLWRVTLLSASDRPVSVRVSLRLLDAQSRQPLMSGLTSELVIHKGITVLSSSPTLITEYEYLTHTIDRSANGLLPVGNYIGCYSLVVTHDKAGNQPGEDCVPFTVEPLSPPLLNYPAHKSIVENTNPQFSWLPPAPLKLFPDLQYEFLLTEVFHGQSPETAIQQNIPVYRALHVKSNFHNYPASAIQLDTSKQYAWTVFARNQDFFAGQSEVWLFRFQGRAISAADKGIYAQLKREPDGTVIDCSEVLQVSYDHETADSTVQCEVLDLERGNKPVYSKELKVRRGNNQLEIALHRGGKWAYGKIYLFSLRNSRGENWQVKFIRHKQ